jgi:glycosyltransferase involved in cell wall biosynthesis
MKPKVLMIGASPPPYHGQAICFSAATEAIKNKAVIETCFRSTTRFRSVLKLLAYLKQIIHYRISKKPETIYFLASRSAIGGIRDIILLLTFRNSDCRIINHLHGADFKEYINSFPAFLKPFFVSIYNRIDLHILLSIVMKDQILENFPKARITSIPNFASIPPESTPKNYSKKLKSFVFLSSIAFSKGIIDAIEIADKLYRTDNQITLDIAGPFLGDEYKSESEIQALFLKKIENKAYIRYYGTLGQKAKFNLLHRSSHFILPTFFKSEAYPLSIIEAMACSCTIITTNHNYLGQIFSKENGVIIPVNDPLKASELLREFLSEDEIIESIGNHNAMVAKSQHSLAQYQSAILNTCSQAQ